MKKVMMVAVLALGLVLMSVPAFALPLGTNITIYDGSYNSTSTNTWYNGKGEDQEVEPNNVANQSWDLEGFFLEGNTLTMVGGFDFANGYGGYDPGDIFFDVSGDVGYDYALKLNFSATTYDVYAVTSGELVVPYFSQNSNSTPWIYNFVSSDLVNTGGSISFNYYEGLANSEVAGLSGGDGTHNAVAIDLGLTGIDFSKGFTAHYTMECGNDNLMGASPVPEPQTLLLMGIGLLGLAFVGRKKMGDRA